MQDYVIKNTSGEVQAIIKTDLEKLKKVNEMHEALKNLLKHLVPMGTESGKLVSGARELMKEIKNT